MLLCAVAACLRLLGARIRPPIHSEVGAPVHCCCVFAVARKLLTGGVPDIYLSAGDGPGAHLFVNFAACSYFFPKVLQWFGRFLFCSGLFVMFDVLFGFPIAYGGSGE